MLSLCIESFFYILRIILKYFFFRKGSGKWFSEEDHVDFVNCFEFVNSSTWEIFRQFRFSEYSIFPLPNSGNIRLFRVKLWMHGSNLVQRDPLWDPIIFIYTHPLKWVNFLITRLLAKWTKRQVFEKYPSCPEPAWPWQQISPLVWQIRQNFRIK